MRYSDFDMYVYAKVPAGSGRGIYDLFCTYKKKILALGSAAFLLCNIALMEGVHDYRGRVEDRLKQWAAETDGQPGMSHDDQWMLSYVLGIPPHEMTQGIPIDLDDFTTEELERAILRFEEAYKQAQPEPPPENDGNGIEKSTSI
jgi:hypothetical protein